MAKDMKLDEAGKQLFLLFICLLTLPLCAECDKVVRLWPSRCSGRVEVFHRGRWGTVCDDNWKAANSDVLCRELGCGQAMGTRHGADPGHTYATIWLDDVRCNGTESSIIACDHKPFGDNNCDHTEDAGVTCSDGVRLGNGTNRCSGTLEVFRDGQWGMVCNSNWNENLSKAVCKQLECGLPRRSGSTSQQQMGYISSCPVNGTSFSQCNLTKSSATCSGLALTCEGVRDIRLVNGSDRCSGRVEVFIENRWGTVCDDDWDLRDTRVVCQAMDCGAPLKSVSNARFGQGSGEIWLDNMECAGNESGLLQCQHNAIGDNNCGHSEDAGVICASQIRLINGTTDCSGRVEFFHNGQWSSARRSTWGTNQASVVCRQMNCGAVVSFSGSNSASEPGKMYDVDCTGNESALKDCTIKQYNQTSVERSEDATVVCTGNVLISDGPNRCAGRVEVFHKDQWADVSSDSWDMNDATVVCQQLKCGAPHKIIPSPPRPGSTVRVNGTYCNGREMALSMCTVRFTNRTSADSSQTVAGVICLEGLVARLGNGQDRCSGRVEIRRGDEWGTLCDMGWDLNKAKIMCDLLECGHAVNTSSRGTYPPGVGPVFDASGTCLNSLNSIHQCSKNGFTASSCGHDKDASLVCGGDSSIRLVNGTDRCSGRVEILYSAKWGTVCDDDWDINDAQIVCQSRDCGSALAAVPGSFFGQGVGDIWLDDVNCFGNESSLVECGRTPFGQSNCGHGEDAGVICSAHLRLSGGTNQCSGNVEIFYDGEWLPAVSVNWGRSQAAVVCREMNCGDPLSVTGPSSRSELLRGFKVRCSGRESSVSQCTVVAYTGADTERLRHASVSCSGIVKLSDGPNRCAGRAEVFHNGQWGNVCGASWDLGDAKVVCQQLGCGDPFKITTEPDYGYGTGAFMVEHIACTGRESLLHQCGVTYGGKRCNSSSVAGVICADSLGIRLVDGPDRCSGRVEVRMGNGWGSMCGADWSVGKAENVCELLDCGHAATASTVLHRGTAPVSNPDQSCYSSAQSLKHCLHRGLARATCATNNDASVVCANQIRLVGGPNPCSGRVEVLHKGQWGTVCDDDWGMDDARVVCRQLFCGTPSAVHSGAHFGRGTGPTWLDNVGCTGSENVLTQCPHNGFGNHNCGHEEDAGVTCIDMIDKPSLLMSPDTKMDWGDRLDITCTVEGQEAHGTFTLKKNNDTFKMEKYSENTAATFAFQKVNFSLGGLYYCEYKKNQSSYTVFYPPGEAVQLTVTVTPAQPGITITSPDPMLIPRKDDISVYRGQRFNITCSVQSKYPGGFFYLTKGKVKASETKPSVRRSDQEVVDFVFPSAQDLHQGNYSCVYGVNLSSRSFNSKPSHSLQLTVLAGSSVALAVVLTLFLLAVLVVVGYFVWKKQMWSSDTMVRFVNRIGGAIQGIGGNSSVEFKGPESFTNAVYMDGIEEPPGVVNHDHEPLVLTK